MINTLEFLLTFPFILEKEKISLNGEIKPYVVAWENKQHKKADQKNWANF